MALSDVDRARARADFKREELDRDLLSDEKKARLRAYVQGCPDWREHRAGVVRCPSCIRQHLGAVFHRIAVTS